MRYWLLKSDPETFSWEDLVGSPGRTTRWDGVRNYQARNSLRDDAKAGDGVLFYLSQDERAIVGLATVTRSAYPDPTQFDRKSPQHDPGSDPDAPRWYAIDIRADRALATPVTLERLRTTPGLAKMALLQKGSRLSVQPVTAKEWEIVTGLGEPARRPSRPPGTRR